VTARVSTIARARVRDGRARGARLARVAVHAPVCAMDAPAAPASHELPYTTPSQPQTGITTAGQTSGRLWQVPAPSQLGAWAQ